MNAFQFLGNVLYSQFFVKPPLPTASFANQTVIVTGSNTGIGYEAVKHFIRLNAAKIILAVRTTAKGDAAILIIIKETKCDPSRLEVWEFDLASSKSVRGFVERARNLERLDVVVQNAGIFPPNEWNMSDGMELTLKVNTLNAVYFAYAILPKLRESAAKTGLMGRFSFNGSDAMFISGIQNQTVSGSLMDAFNDPKQSSKFGDRYALSKALLFYSMHTMASQSPVVPGSGSNVLIDAVTPGATKSDIFTRDKRAWWQVPIIALLNGMARNTDVGARTLVHAVEPNLGPEAHGRFLMNSRIMMNNPMLGNEKAEVFQKRWKSEILPFLENIEARVTEI
ncbi:NAD(P)-binding protein [Microthyrium microscopicum]|uniref:NAD(P)-binding protein n=1 Tax=Microthyrium microscopicum TaxID=703497 RepID=A0A6A6UFT4_9PEZI|nr:NAD(P)-binding protein [Microthyrium microscopicum]